MKIKATQNRILFQFVDEISGDNFKNKTDWGFQFTQQTEELKAPRWGLVTHVGSKITEVKVGQYALIEPLMWTLGMVLEEGTFWSTSGEKIMATSDERPHA